MQSETKAYLKVLGFSSSGIKAVNQIIFCSDCRTENGTSPCFIAVGTNTEELDSSMAGTRILLGDVLATETSTRINFQAVQENIDSIKAAIEDRDTLFITASIYNKTDVGAVTVIAKAAREVGADIIGVIINPSPFDGTKGLATTKVALAELLEQVDVLVVIPVNSLKQFPAPNAPADILYRTVKTILSIPLNRSISSIDLADLMYVAGKLGLVTIGEGYATGEARGQQAVMRAIANLPHNGISNSAHAILFIIANENMSFEEYNEISTMFHKNIHADADIFISILVDNDLSEEMRVMIITGTTKI